MFAVNKSSIESSNRTLPSTNPVIGAFRPNREVLKSIRNQNIISGSKKSKKIEVNETNQLKTHSPLDKKEAFNSTYPESQVYNISKVQAIRNYKVLAYTTDNNGNKELYDIDSKTKIHKGQNNFRLNKNLLLYETKQGALLEQTNTNLPRVLVSFGKNFVLFPQ